MRTVIHLQIVAAASAIAIVGGGVIWAPPLTAGPASVVITEPAEPVVRYISYPDLNLASKRGEKMLSARVREAITNLCDEATAETDGNYGHQEALFLCSSRAWRQARPQMSLAVRRAHEIAMNGKSNNTADEISLSFPNSYRCSSDLTL